MESSGRRRRAIVLAAVAVALLVALAVAGVVSGRRASSTAEDIHRSLQRSLVPMSAADRTKLIADTSLWGLAPADDPHPLSAAAGGRAPTETRSAPGIVTAAWATRSGMASSCVWLRLSPTRVSTQTGTDGSCRAREPR